MKGRRVSLCQNMDETSDWSMRNRQTSEALSFDGGYMRAIESNILY